MSKAVSTRLNEKELKKIEQVAKKENLDRSTLIRKFLLNGLKEYSMEESSKLYQEGRVSLAEAAMIAEVSLWEMIDFVQRRNIRPPIESIEEIEKEVDAFEGIKNAKE